MRTFVLALLGSTVACAAGTQGKSMEQEATGFDYPPSPRGDVVDDYNGTAVPDPYRWLESPDSEATVAWVKAQNAVTLPYLNAMPSRSAYEDRLTTLWNYERYSIPSERGGRFFFSRNDGLQNQSPLYWAESLDGEPKLLIDPNTLSEDGTVSLSGASVSKDGTLIAYGLSESGSDWVTWKVRRVDTGEDLEDEIRWSKFSGASWLPSGEGFFYGRYDEPKAGTEYDGANYFQKLFFHRIGTAQTEDELVYEDKEHKDWSFGGRVTDDGDYLIISVGRGTEDKNLLFVRRLADGKQVALVGEWKFDYSVIDNVGSRFYLLTDDGAPMKRVLSVDLDQPSEFSEVIAETGDALVGVSLFGETLYARYLKDARSAVVRYTLTGDHAGNVELPGLGTAYGFGGKRDAGQTFFSFESHGQPDSIYRLDLTTGERTVWKQPEVAFNPNDFVTEQIFYTSKDGTKVPMFISRKKSTAIDGQRPTILYGYGGFNISITPTFSPAILAWMETGGLYAVANLRGGSEYGREWHEAGMVLNKQNVFDDFIAAGEWLKSNGYTSSERLAILGRSNGGLLVGATMTQRPDLAAVALPGVGVMDMLRFPEFTIGWAWKSDYGDPKNPEHFKVLHGYSPLHNLKPGTAYPATLVITADHDDRVVPAHSFKFTAALQHAHVGDNPVMIRIETRAGHGASTPTSKRIEEYADMFAFTVHHTGYEKDALKALLGLSGTGVPGSTTIAPSK